MATFFNEYFGVTTGQVDDYGAFNISLINDLPLFIDPFLLFNSNKPEYQQLHKDILRYMIFLRDKIASGDTNPDLIKAWFMFPEVKQNWMGFSLHGNSGSGLGKDFAEALKANLQKLFPAVPRETITSSSHIEKVCLVQSGVGRDMISDFTTNLLKDYICRYTENFAVDHIDASLRRRLPINKAFFNYDTENWERRTYNLPYANGDFVLLTPKDMLTRDENWINRTDMIRDFESIGLERNLQKQLPIYQAASDAEHGIKAIIYFSLDELARVEGILKKLNLLGHKDIVLIDARNDNKPSGSKA